MTDITLGVRLKADGKGLVGEVRLSKRELEKLGKSSKDTARDFKKLDLATKDVSNGFRKMRGLVATLGLTLLVREVVSTASEFEQLRLQLETVTGSADQAADAFDRIKLFARTTPFEVQNITAAFIRLKAAGIEPTDELLQSLGNTAAAFGKDITEFADAVIGATVGESERLKAFGIIARLEADKVKLTFRGTTREINRNADSIVAALAEIGDTDFAGGMERQSQSAAGAFSNLQDAVADFSDQIGESGALDLLTEGIRRVTETVEDLGIIFRRVMAEIEAAQIRQLRGEIAEAFAEIKRLEDLNATVPVIGTEELISDQTAKLEVLGAKLRELLDLRKEAESPPPPPRGEGRETSDETAAAAKAQEELAKSFAKLRDQLDPTRAELAGYREGLDLLDGALSANLITGQQYQQLLAALNRELAEGGENANAAAEAQDALEASLKAAEEAAEAAEQAFRDSREASDGAKRAFMDYADEATNAGAQIEASISNALSRSEDALVQFVQTGKLEFKSLADAIIADLIRIAIQQSVTGPIAGFFAGLGQTAAPSITRTGTTITPAIGPPTPITPPGGFSAAATQGAQLNVVVNNNAPGVEVQSRASGDPANPTVMLDIVRKDIADNIRRGGSVLQAIEQTTGARRQPRAT